MIHPIITYLFNFLINDHLQLVNQQAGHSSLISDESSFQNVLKI